MMGRPIMLVASLALVACTDETGTRRALEAQGFTNVETRGWAPLSCGDKDDFATKFTATNTKGKRVSGVVCCGVMKDCTIRY